MLPTGNSFSVGDNIEFLSSDGRWKPGVVVKLAGAFIPDGVRDRHCSPNLRICVGKGVHVVRLKRKCRKVVRNAG